MTPDGEPAPDSWTPDAWRAYPAAHQVAYDDQAALNAALGRLGHLPGLVSPGEVERLRGEIARAAAGDAFILQGGDCVERFDGCTPATIENTLRVLLQMSVVLTYASRTPVVRIGRIAGQYFKPRSRATEIIDGHEVLTFRGDPVHRFAAAPAAIDPRIAAAPTPAVPPIVTARRPDPARLEAAYFHAAATLNAVRALIAGGFADLHHPQTWDLGHMTRTDQWREYRDVLDRILDAIGFMESFGGVDEASLGRVSLYTSHEALHLPWETALTRRDDASGHWYATSAHTVWIGARTADPGGAHVAWAAGIRNPVGVKIGPAMTAERLVRIAARIDPTRDDGRLIAVTRVGAGRAAELVAPLVAALRREGHRAAWIIDPMHGNTVTAAGGRKTRRFEDVLAELRESFAAHAAGDSRAVGVHFELTGEDVTECVGGAVPLAEGDLERRYESVCDPRLNDSQSMEVAFLLARLIRDARR